MNLEELIEKYGEKKAAKIIFKYWKSGKTLDDISRMFNTNKTRVWNLLYKYYPWLRMYRAMKKRGLL